MKKRIYTLLIIILFCFFITYILHKICIEQNINVSAFERNFKVIKSQKLKEIYFSEDVYKIIDIKDNFVFLTSDGLYRIIKFDLTNSKIIIKKLNHKNHNSNIIGDSIYAFDPSNKKGYIYSTNNLEFKNSFTLGTSFDRALAVNSKNVLLRSVSNVEGKYEFSSYNLQSKDQLKLKIQLQDSSEIDGGLTTDGYFSYFDNNIVFTQYKKGNFYHINNKLNKIKHFKTLDNIQNNSKIKMTNDSSFYFDGPALNTNLLTVMDKEFYYIVSFVKGKNDKLNTFTKYRTVDVYNSTSGNYKHSFYLPNDINEKPIDFKIINKKLFLLFKNKLKIYEFL